MTTFISTNTNLQTPSIYAAMYAALIQLLVRVYVANTSSVPTGIPVPTSCLASFLSHAHECAAGIILATGPRPHIVGNLHLLKHTRRLLPRYRPYLASKLRPSRPLGALFVISSSSSSFLAAETYGAVHRSPLHATVSSLLPTLD